MYSRYANEYDLNVDREETLKQMCKVSLKLDQAIDMNVVSDIKSLTATLDSLRKSGKFTEAQNKDEKVRYLDTIGELVALCEREGGIIEQMPDPDEYPQDKIDFTIKDMKNYTYNLVSNEYGLGDLIESYIEKLEKSEEMDDLDLEGKDFVLSAEDAEKQALSQTEAEEFAAYQHELALEDETLNEAEALLAQFGGN